MLNLIKERRSIRKYTSEPVLEADVRRLLEAAMAAPSASNRQPWRFVVVRDPETRAALSRVKEHGRMAAGAPVVVVVCGREDVSSLWVEDCSAATQNLLLAATALGLGGVWVGIHGENEHKVREILRLPNHLRTLCFVPIGHPAEAHPASARFDPAKIYSEAFPSVPVDDEPG